MTADVVVYALIFGLFAGLAAAALERLAALATQRSRARGAPGATRREPVASRRGLPPVMRLPWAVSLVATAAAPFLGAGSSAGAAAASAAVSDATSVIASETASGAFWPTTVALLTTIPAASWELIDTALHTLSAAAVSALRPIDALIAPLWALTSLALLGSGAIIAARLHGQRQRWEERTVDGVSVLVSGDCGPAVVGLWSARIVIPAWLLEFAEPLRAMVLQHEREHLRARDPGLLLVAALALLVQPWNPALWWQIRRLRLAIEMDCDARVLRGGADVERYGLLLLAVGQRTRRNLSTVAALAEDRTFIARRIANMTANTDSPAIRRVLLWGALTSVAVAVACNIPDTGSVTEIVSGEVEPVATSLAVLDSEDAYFEFQVAKSAEPLPGSPVPEYPVDLRSAGVSGRVVAQFVVGTEGMALPGSFVVIESNNEGFTEAVRSALPRMRFSPAELEGGTKVKQFVQQPFLFVVE